MKRKVISIIIAAASLSATAQPKLTVQNIKEVVAAMTLEEKAALAVIAQPSPPNSNDKISFRFIMFVSFVVLA